uniref:Copper transport protein n=1 Tax=Cairina moschata TaxID=8855 RepID=A0A8C3BM65_CAIMO
MPMTFFFSDTVVLLFDFWSVHTPTGLALSLLVVALLSVLYEVVKMGKARVLRRALLAVPPSLSREELLEPEEGDGGHGATQGRYGPGRVGPSLGCPSPVGYPGMCPRCFRLHPVPAAPGVLLGWGQALLSWCSPRQGCPGRFLPNKTLLSQNLGFSPYL